MTLSRIVPDYFSLVPWPASDPVTFWGSVFSIAVGVLTIIYWTYRCFATVHRRHQSRLLRPGIYKGFWIDSENVEVYCEILHLRRWFGGFRAHPLYVHKRKHNYVLKATPLRSAGDVFVGEWTSKQSALYRGVAMFRYDDPNLDLQGRWLGPRSDHSINGGEWYLFRHAATANNKYLRPPLSVKLEHILARLRPERSIIEDIIAKHRKFGAQTTEVEGVRLDIQEDCFVPQLGKASIPLARYVREQIRRGDRVLDVGSGTGFYAILCACDSGTKAVGIDVVPELVNLARSNASKNNVAHLTEFRTCQPDDLFSAISEDEKFDVILANLPFSAYRKTFASRDSSLYSCFAGSRGLMEQLILGSPFHAKPSTRLIFCYGKSGYWEFLHDLIDVSVWKAVSTFEVQRSADDVFYILDLRLSDFVQHAYARLEEVRRTPKRSRTVRR